MTKLLLGLLGAAVIATGGYAAASGVDTDPARTVSLPGVTDGTTGTTTDETTTGAATTGATTTDEADDVSGPCDEAEHRNDQRCAGSTAPPPAPASTATGGTTTDDVDSGRGHGDDDRDEDDSSGRGRGGDDDDRDDHDDDDSGPDSGRG